MKILAWLTALIFFMYVCFTETVIYESNAGSDICNLFLFLKQQTNKQTKTKQKNKQKNTHAHLIKINIKNTSPK